MKTLAVIGLGASLGDRRRHLDLAVQALDATAETQVVATSRVWASTPMGGISRRPFLNAAVAVLTEHSARGLFQRCKEIEARVGRKSALRWADRAIDLDVLLYGDMVRRANGLRLPHPGLLQRPFALEPAREVAPQAVHPIVRRPLAALASAPPLGCWPVGVLRPPGLAGPTPLHYRFHPPEKRGRAEPIPRVLPPASRRSTPMKFFLDTANLDEIREAHSWGIIDGVTTNPSLIAREGGDFVDTIHQICEIVHGPVSAETVSQDSEGMIREGRILSRISEHVVIKVPLSIEGLKATRALSDDGIDVNVTLCFQASQALVAAKAGAAYISPFMGRLDDVSTDGVQLIEQIVQIYSNYPELGTEVLAASIRHPLHVMQVALVGCDVATIPFKVLAKLVNHPLTDKGNAAFLKDWETVPDNDIVGQVSRWLEANGK